MKQPDCDCIRRVLNRFINIEGITTTAEVYYVQRTPEKGLEECSVFLESKCCPECGTPYVEKGD